MMRGLGTRQKQDKVIGIQVCGLKKNQESLILDVLFSCLDGFWCRRELFKIVTREDDDKS